AVAKQDDRVLLVVDTHEVQVAVAIQVGHVEGLHYRAGNVQLDDRDFKLAGPGRQGNAHARTMADGQVHEAIPVEVARAHAEIQQQPAAAAVRHLDGAGQGPVLLLDIHE